MSVLSQIDIRRKRLLPVIHCVDPYKQQGIRHALANTKTALENGADGVFLIGHNLYHEDLILIYEEVRKQHPEAWIGINFLDINTSTGIHPPVSAVRQCSRLSGLWMESLPSTSLKVIAPQTEIFGGVAFKYRNADANDIVLKHECNTAAKTTHFATTSGIATGSPPSLEKLKKIHALLKGRALLAVASGVDESNVTEMLPCVHTFLVASSLLAKKLASSPHENFIPEKVRGLAEVIHQN